MSKQSFWCWLRRHRMLVGGYDYSGRRIVPIMVCQCKIEDTEIPSIVDQLRGKK